MRHLITGLMSLSFVASTVLIAHPASAATLAPTAVLCDGPNATVFLPANNISAGLLDTITIQNVTGGNLNVGLSGITSSNPGVMAGGGNVTFTIRTFPSTITFTSTSGDCNGSSVVLTFVSGGGGGGGGGGGESSSAPAAAPQIFELSLAPTDGTACTNSSQSGSAGTWVNLPAANDCTPPASKPNANLLGWATSSDFPVAIAKRQVDNGWGAYETFNTDGQLTGVFIPAGGSTLVSAAGNLYAIWSE